MKYSLLEVVAEAEMAAFLKRSFLAGAVLLGRKQIDLNYPVVRLPLPFQGIGQFVLLLAFPFLEYLDYPVRRLADLP
jgi:hypothetical protein